METWKLIESQRGLLGQKCDDFEKRHMLERLGKKTLSWQIFFFYSLIYQRKNLDSGYVKAYPNDFPIARYLSTGGYHKHSTMSLHILDGSILNMRV